MDSMRTYFTYLARGCSGRASHLEETFRFTLPHDYICINHYSWTVSGMITTKYPFTLISPSITLNLLKEAKELGVPALWLQPGAENDEVKSYIAEAGLTDKVILGGPCVLVEGEGIIRSLL